MKPLFVIGTRPECIKLAPVIRECYARGIECFECFTGQHLDSVLEIADHFGIGRRTNVPDRIVGRHPLPTSFDIIRDYCRESDGADIIVGQGDTFSALAAAQVAFFTRTPFVHVEAGLRSGNLRSPWPEEFNRRCVSLATSLHCCPTQRAVDNLMFERQDGHIVLTGNTVVDALLWTAAQEEESTERIKELRDDFRPQDEGLVIVTAHRRENQGGGILRICQVVSILAEKFPKVGFFWAAHPNPAVRKEMNNHPSWPRNVIIQEPFSYPRMVSMLKNCTLVLTDSGGLQEEAPTFKKPVVVLREETERQELVEAGGAVLVGTDVERIVEETSRLLSDVFAYAGMQVERNPFGDGKASARIVDAMQDRF